MSLVPVESGEATPFDPIDFLQFIPFGAGVAKPISALERNAIQGFRQLWPLTITKVTQSGGAPIKTESKNILNQIKRFILPATVGGGAVASTTIPKQVETVVTNQGGRTVLTTVDKLATKGLIAGGLVTVGTGLITLTPTGQQIATSGGQVATDFSGFIKQNGQLLSIFLIIAGGALLVGALRK